MSGPAGRSPVSLRGALSLDPSARFSDEAQAPRRCPAFVHINGQRYSVRDRETGNQVLFSYADLNALQVSVNLISTEILAQPKDKRFFNPSQAFNCPSAVLTRDGAYTQHDGDNSLLPYTGWTEVAPGRLEALHNPLAKRVCLHIRTGSHQNNPISYVTHQEVMESIFDHLENINFFSSVDHVRNGAGDASRTFGSVDHLGDAGPADEPPFRVGGVVSVDGGPQAPPRSPTPPASPSNWTGRDLSSVTDGADGAGAARGLLLQPQSEDEDRRAERAGLRRRRSTRRPPQAAAAAARTDRRRGRQLLHGARPRDPNSASLAEKIAAEKEKAGPYPGQFWWRASSKYDWFKKHRPLYTQDTKTFWEGDRGPGERKLSATRDQSIFVCFLEKPTPNS